MPEGTKDLMQHFECNSSYPCLFNVTVSYFEKAVAKFHGKVQVEDSFCYFSELPELKVVAKELCDVSLLAFGGNGNV